MKKLKWHLNESNFTYLDRLKIALFFLNPKKRWTQGNEVFNYENLWKNYVGSKFALSTSSGTTANYLIAQQSLEKNPSKNIVVFPSVTWQTSVSPWVNFGFEPKFIDISLTDFSMDLNLLEDYLSNNNDKVNTVFVTSLIGVTPDIPRLKGIGRKYNVDIKLDNCENTFGSYEGKHICSEVTSSTSLYFGHQCTTGTEGGLIFTNSEEEFVSFVLNRSHGMTRELKNYNLSKNYSKALGNKLVDPLFDFRSLGSNCRISNIQAYMGKLDFSRLEYYIDKRRELYSEFSDNLDANQYILPKTYSNRENVMFCLPILSRTKNKKKIKSIIKTVQKLGIEYRPIISGNLLRQTCYKKFNNFKNFKVAEHVHNYGIYVGLHPKLKNGQVKELAEILNETK